MHAESFYIGKVKPPYEGDGGRVPYHTWDELVAMNRIPPGIMPVQLPDGKWLSRQYVGGGGDGAGEQGGAEGIGGCGTVEGGGGDGGGGDGGGAGGSGGGGSHSDEVPAKIRSVIGAELPL